MNSLFLATIFFFWFQSSLAAPLTVTTSSKNLIADLLAGFKATSTSISQSSANAATPLVPQVATISIISSSPLSLPTTTGPISVSPATPAGTGTAYSTDDLNAILSQIAAAGTTTYAGATTTAPSATKTAFSTAASATSASSASSSSGSSSGIFSVFISVIEYLVKTFSSSGTLTSLVEDAVDLLDGSSSSTTTAVVASTSAA